MVAIRASHYTVLVSLLPRRLSWLRSHDLQKQIQPHNGIAEAVIIIKVVRSLLRHNRGLCR